MDGWMDGWMLRTTVHRIIVHIVCVVRHAAHNLTISNVDLHTSSAHFGFVSAFCIFVSHVRALKYITILSAVD